MPTPPPRYHVGATRQSCWGWPRWPSPRAPTAAASRSSHAVARVTGGDGRERVSFLEMPLEEVSSSLVRERVARGEPVVELVGAPVASYIAEQGLYREAT